MKKLLIIFSAFLTLTNESFAATAQGTVEAVIVSNLQVSQSTPLNFGSFSSSASAGTINQAGTATGGVTAVAGGATRTGAVFAVLGSSNTPYTFVLPVNSEAIIGIGGSGGTNPMTVTLSFASGNGSRTLSGTSENVTLNGTLAVAANQPAGSYTGTYNVTVNY